MSIVGNTFNKNTVSYGHSTKVWREAKSQYPAGGVFDAASVSAFLSAGKIPSGTPLKYDGSTKTLTAYTDAQITGASDLSTLGINAYLYDDVPLESSSTVGTGTAIYAGEIYEYMFASAVVAKLKTLTTVPMIVWVQ